MASPILTEVRFGSPRTFPDCIYIGICSLRSDDDEFAVGECPKAKAWVSRSEKGLKIQFVRSTVQPCARAKQFAGDVFRVISPYGLTENFAKKVGLPKNTAWEIPQGDYPVLVCERFLTVEFPLVAGPRPQTVEIGQVDPSVSSLGSWPDPTSTT